MQNKITYKYKDKDYDSKEAMLEAYKEDYRKSQRENDEDEIRRLKRKDLIWSYRKNIIWILATITPLVILGVIKLIELIQKWLKS